jgi:Flp pilus assembly protein TadG
MTQDLIMKTILPRPQRKEKGQILVIMALIFIGLIAIIGLALDLGSMYVNYARLTRAADAAALGATTQFKKNVTTATLQKAARELLVMNGVSDETLASVLIDTCTSTKADLVRFPGGAGDPALCTSPPRKIVRVIANQNVPMYFMSVVGIPSVPIRVSVVSEAAAVDLVLVLDRSNSMGFFKEDGSPFPNPKPDPWICNQAHPLTASMPVGEEVNRGNWTGDCHPFHEVKVAAFTFIEQFMDPEYDRIALVIFDRLAYRVNFGTSGSPIYLLGKGMGIGDPKGTLEDAIRKTWMYDGYASGSTSNGDSRSPINYSSKGQNCGWTTSDSDPTADFLPCRLFDAGGTFQRIDCYGFYINNFSACGGTNIGMALSAAASTLASSGRQESLWVTILLTDGIPNIGYGVDAGGNPGYFCPAGRPRSPDNAGLDPWCSDRDVDPDHRHGIDEIDDYDVLDYTMDQADVLADGVNSIIFTIGMPPDVTATNYSDSVDHPQMGATLLDYIAEKGQTGNYYEASTAELRKVFLTIANKIGTRLTK